MRPLRSVRFWLGIVAGVLALWIAIRDVPFSDFGRALADADYVWLLPAVTLQLVAMVLRAKRWVVLLDGEDRLADSFWAQTIGYLFTNVLPFRLGEPARVIVMSERCRLPIVQVAASAVVERLLDVATILLLLVLVLPFMEVPTLVTTAGLSAAVVILLAPLFLLLAVRYSEGIEGLLQSACRWCKFLPAGSVVARWRELVEGLRGLMRWRIAAASVGWSLVSWALPVVAQWCILRIFHSEGTLVEAAFVMVALAFAVAVPSSPGFVGIYQLVGQQALVVPFGAKYTAASALAIILTAHLMYYLVTTSAGVVGLLKLGKSFAVIGRAVAATQAARKQSLPESAP